MQIVLTCSKIKFIWNPVYFKAAQKQQLLHRNYVCYVRRRCVPSYVYLTRHVYISLQGHTGRGNTIRHFRGIFAHFPNVAPPHNKLWNLHQRFEWKFSLNPTCFSFPIVSNYRVLYSCQPYGNKTYGPVMNATLWAHTRSDALSFQFQHRIRSLTTANQFTLNKS